MEVHHTFRELLQDVSLTGRFTLLAEAIKTIAGEAWPEDTSVECIEHCYQEVVEELLALPEAPKDEPPHEFIRIDFTEEQQYDVEVADILTENHDSQPLDFTPWVSIIDLPVIDEETRPVVEQVAAILYEITFWAFSQSELRKRESDLFGMHKSCFADRWKKKILERASTAKEFLETQKQDAIGDIELTDDPQEIESLNEEIEEVKVIMELIDTQVEEYLEKVDDAITDDNIVTIKDMMDVWPPILLPKPEFEAIDIDREKIEQGHICPLMSMHAHD